MMNFVPVHCSPPTWPFLCFIVMSGVVEFHLRFNLFPRHEVCGEFRVFFCRFAFYRVRLTSAPASMFRRWPSS